MAVSLSGQPSNSPSAARSSSIEPAALARRRAEEMAFEQAQPMVYQELWNLALEEAYREWMEELRGQTYIARRGHFADAARFG